MVMQKVPEGYNHVYWMNNVILQDSVKKTRDEVMNIMETEYNIEMRPIFYPMHIMPPYYDETVSCPVAEKIASRGISLPSHALLNEEQIKYVCDALKTITKS